MNKAKPDDIGRRLNIWLDFYRDAPLGELYAWERQEAFVAWMCGKGWSASYQQRIINDGRAAINYALKRNAIRHAPKIIGIEGASASRYEWTITPRELGSLFDTMDPERHEHLFRYLLIRMHTACRGDAVLDLSPSQVHLCDSHSWLDLSPDGRKQTKKHRPRQPIADTLKPWLEYWSRPDRLACGASRTHKIDDHTPFVNYHGRPIQSLKMAFNRVRDGAGLPRICQPRMLRHTLTTWLYNQDVPDRQIAMFLGHDEASVNEAARFATTSRRYQHLKPSYCGHAKQAVELFAKEVQSNCERKILINAPITPHLHRTFSTIEEAPPKIGEAFQGLLERANGFEPSTSTLARLRSTN